MTEEEKREQILKRALPALFITIVYFVFISDIMGEQTLKAKEAFEALSNGGSISADALPNIYKQREQVQKQFNTLQTEQKKHLTKIKGMVGFLSGDTSTTESAAILANILAKHKVRVAKEISEPFNSTDLPPALAEVKGLLQESIKAGEVFTVQHLWLHGSFQNMYAALAEMNQIKLAAIPISFSLSVPEKTKAGVLDWELVLWM